MKLFRLKIWVAVFCFATLLLAKTEEQSEFSVFYPTFVEIGAPYTISLVATLNDASTKEVSYTLISAERLSFKNAYIRTANLLSTLRVSESFLSEKQAYEYKVRFSPQVMGLTQQETYQILLSIITDDNAEVSFNVFSPNSKEIEAKKIKTEETNSIFEEESSYQHRIFFYERESVAGTKAVVDENSEIEIGIASIIKPGTFYKDTKSYVLESWITFEENDFPFLALRNSFDDSELFRLSLNRYDLLSFDAGLEHIGYFHPIMVSPSSWYHFAIEYFPASRELYLYWNGYFFATFRIPREVIFEKPIFRFCTFENTKSFSLDLLRIWENEGSYSRIEKFRNYTTAKTDSSKLLFQTTFDNDNQSDINGEIRYSTKHLLFEKSDAPVFTTAPSLNVTSLQNSYLLEWGGGDYQNADYYVLEKAVDNMNYYQVIKIPAETFEEKTYQYTDVSDKTNKVVYYRVQQVNSDSSITYSSALKIGQGEIAPFEIQNNYPNPFNPRTVLHIEILESTFCEIIVHSLDGEIVAHLHEGVLSEGHHEFTFDGSNLPSGIYLYTIHSPGFSKTEKMILAK